MKISNFKRAEKDIVEYITSQKYMSFSESALYKEFVKMRGLWEIGYSKTGTDFVNFLTQNGILEKRDFNSDRGIIRTMFYVPKIDDLTIYMGLKKESYFTHYTAMYLNQLTLQIPKTYYLNFEHYSKFESSELTQESIDKALNKPQRKSSDFFASKGNKIVMLNGAFTSRLGVIAWKDDTRKIEHTDIERTLIDISIRPVYAGGVFEVLNAYEIAKPILDIKKIYNYLKKLEYAYPYQQVVGFYLDKAGYSESVVEQFRNDLTYDFYLTYNMNKKEYSKYWKLWYPKGM